MKRLNQNSTDGKYWLLILSIICVVLMLLSWSNEDSDGVTEFIASYTVAPMQEGINSVGVLIRDFMENFETLEDLRAENEELQEQLDNQIIENGILQQNSYELERLQELYELDANTSEYTKVGARVISKEAGNWFQSFTIDKGSNDGLTVDMNVIAGTGLVGIITKVGDNWATVTSIIDDSSNVSAMVVATGDNCIVSGDLTLMQDGVIRFEQLPIGETGTAIGEELVTSYISDKYVQGITIGVITKVETDANGLTQSGYITTAVDFTQLQEVLIITETKDIGGDE